MTHDEIIEIADKLMPNGYTCRVKPFKDGLIDVWMVRPDGTGRGTYFKPEESAAAVKNTIGNVIIALGGRPKKEEE